MPGTVSLDQVSMKFILRHQKTRSFQQTLVNFFHGTDDNAEEFWALRDVSFEVEPGHTLGVIGTNGSGKSTILKLITKIIEPTTGAVTVKGSVSALIELGAGFHPDLTGRENIYLNGSILGFGRKEMGRRLQEIVAFSELERFIDTPVKHYSSGMYMRLGFSVAISVDPDVLIIDEVLSVGDSAFQAKCFDRISDFRRRGKTIVLVSHALPTIQQLCEKVLWLEKGAVRELGDADRVLQHYAESSTTGFWSTPPTDSAGEAAAIPDRSNPDCQPGAAPIISQMKLLSAEFGETGCFHPSDQMIVRFFIDDNGSDVEPTLNLQIRRADGVVAHESVCQLTSYSGGPTLNGWVDLEIDSVPLLDGTYDISIWSGGAIRLSETGLNPSHPCTKQFVVEGHSQQGGLVPLTYRLVARNEVAELVETAIS